VQNWTLFRRVSEKNIFRIVHLLAENSLTPTQLSEKIGVKCSTIRSTLTNMKELGFVTSSKRGRYRDYRLKESLPSAVHELLLVIMLSTDVRIRAFPGQEELEAASLPKELIDQYQARYFSEIGKEILSQLFLPKHYGQRKKSLEETLLTLDEITDKLD
jgi:DNA-binding transcriptional ArsR family regulator